MFTVKILFNSLILLSFVGGQGYAADALDQSLQEKLKFFDVTALKDKKPQGADYYKVEMGLRLFLDTNLSGNRRVSCFTCHTPGLGTSDARPFSLTEDRQDVVKRNAQSIFNMKSSGDRFYFWDGRIEYDKKTHRFKTPEPAISGATPEELKIVEALEDGLSAQAIFPIASREEMRGKVGENEVANEETNIGAWKKIVERVQSNFESYYDLYKKAFPGNDFKEMNIGHVGSALSRFMEYEFYSWDSPFNRYVAGDVSALSLKEKKGLEVFLGRGMCIACHQGSFLGLNTFFTNVGVPELASSLLERDLGRYEVTKLPRDRHFYKVPSLRNVALSAPYFHNGAKRTLREVVEHYNGVFKSVDEYIVPKSYDLTSVVPLRIFDSKEERNELKTSVQAGFLRRGLGLTEEEKDNLVHFLENSLTDPKFKNHFLVRLKRK